MLDSCQKRDAVRHLGGSIGGFSCSTADVLSCIMHVISKGCVRRNEDNLHIVEFVPEDPSTPQKGQAQFSFSHTDIRKNSNANEPHADIRFVIFQETLFKKVLSFNNNVNVPLKPTVSVSV